MIIGYSFVSVSLGVNANIFRAANLRIIVKHYLFWNDLWFFNVVLTNRNPANPLKKSFPSPRIK